MPNGEGGLGGGGGGGIGPGELPSFPDDPGSCDTPLIKDNAVLKRAVQTYKDIFRVVKCASGSNWLSHTVAGLSILPIVLAGVVLGLVIAPLAKILSTVGATVLELLGESRKEAAPQLNDLMIATMNEMFGVEFSAEDLPTKGDAAAARERARILGQKVIGLLESEFAPTGKISPEQGQDAARTFTGFTVNFSVVSAFISILGEMVSAGQLESFRELGVELADNMGLGRLARRGLSELVSATVSDPYEWYLNRKYRPKLLTTGQYINAYLGRRLDSQGLYDALALQGYSTERINELIAQHQASLNLDDLDVLLRYGAWTRGDVIAHLTTQGFTPETAEAKLRAHDLKRVDGLVRDYIAVLRKQREDEVLDDLQFRSSLENLPITEEESLTIRRITGAKLELPRRQLTLAQMENAFVQGLVDLDELDDFLRREGYSSDDQTILRFQTLLKTAAAAEAAEAAEERKKKRAAAKK